MKILIIAATWMEVKLLADEFEFLGEKSNFLKKYQLADIAIDILIAGIGTTFTTFHLTNTLQQNNYQLVFNIGIAGSLSRELKIGQVVNVVSEEFADLGIEKKEEFLTLFETGFIDSNEFPFEGGLLKASGGNGMLDFIKVRGITTNKSHGRSSSIAEINEKFSAHIESMEGAAVFYVCSWLGVSCYQIRAISNFVEPRDSSHWNIPLALENLKTGVLNVLTKLTVPVN
ncbi:MAG: futalosine hydrolase [Prolixibacteraceae bacterium]|jgi:futalosine hydrolase|nr:futalosine hydrolase [Prolixibacteraceae bacterium]MBT6007165.1 futalosine hydrolase [Prolixibacteraceae bacterium]MBT6764242.1 futalosine hydrolase [Prolixibacteraceae bacterium]MBT6996987.1 futalosine hydrolase [Prolixibacteraceae bacterium]MBT7395507.1 futalosine hydrolase [Prolixibacteraceae bacterium]